MDTNGKIYACQIAKCLFWCRVPQYLTEHYIVEHGARLSEGHSFTMNTSELYLDIIKKLLEGWEPKHENGKLVQWWVHPTKPFNYEERMSSAEFVIIEEVDEQLQAEGWIPRDDR